MVCTVSKEQTRHVKQFSVLTQMHQFAEFGVNRIVRENPLIAGTPAAIPSQYLQRLLSTSQTEKVIFPHIYRYSVFYSYDPHFQMILFRALFSFPHFGLLYCGTMRSSE